MHVLGYILALFIGLSLGLVGSGGSILAVPLLLYFFGLQAVTATAYSLFIVGISASIGATRLILKKQIDLKTAFSFASTSILTVYVVRRFIVPGLPDLIVENEYISVSNNTFIVLVFTLVMGAAAIRMIKQSKLIAQHKAQPSYFRIALQGIAVGGLVGFVGAGGGFLIIPALVLLVGLPMKKAIGTSLLIIAVQSLLGFIGDVQTRDIDWPLLLSLGAIASAGIFFGIWLGTRIDGAKLKSGFGWFILSMAIFMLFKEVLIQLI